jgi:hypothetical protein
MRGVPMAVILPITRSIMDSRMYEKNVHDASCTVMTFIFDFMRGTHARTQTHKQRHAITYTLYYTIRKVMLISDLAAVHTATHFNLSATLRIITGKVQPLFYIK